MLIGICYFNIRCAVVAAVVPGTSKLREPSTSLEEQSSGGTPQSADPHHTLGEKLVMNFHILKIGCIHKIYGDRHLKSENITK